MSRQRVTRQKEKKREVESISSDHVPYHVSRCIHVTLIPSIHQIHVSFIRKERHKAAMRMGITPNPHSPLARSH
jgi:hypothetical protein